MGKIYTSVISDNDLYDHWIEFHKHKADLLWRAFGLTTDLLGLPKSEPVYQTLVCSHHIDEDQIPAIVLQEARDKCEAGVRRVLRAWPDGARLDARIVQKGGQTFVEAFWA